MRNGIGGNRFCKYRYNRVLCVKKDYIKILCSHLRMYTGMLCNNSLRPYILCSPILSQYYWILLAFIHQTQEYCSLIFLPSPIPRNPRTPP